MTPDSRGHKVSAAGAARVILHITCIPERLGEIVDPRIPQGQSHGAPHHFRCTPSQPESPQKDKIAHPVDRATTPLPGRKLPQMLELAIPTNSSPWTSSCPLHKIFMFRFSAPLPY